MAVTMMLPLSEIAEYSRTLRSRPPRIVHATAWLLLLALGGAAIWAEFTQADLVVRGAGRMRPLTPPQKVYPSGRGEVLSASTGGRVVSVHYAEGQVVRAGDVLIRLDTGRVDNEIEQRRRTIAAGEAELARLAVLQKLAEAQDAATREKFRVELESAELELKTAEARRALELRRAEIEKKTAEEETARVNRLAASRAVSANEVAAARTRLAEATEKLQAAALPTSTGRVRVCREALALAGRETAVRLEEFALKQDAKRGEVAAAKLGLEALELERKSAAVTAPVGGVVTTAPVKVGDLLPPGKSAVEIAERDGFRFEAVLQTGDVGELRPGMAARIKLDAYDYQRYGVVEGTVESISPDSAVADGQQTPVYTVRIATSGEDVGRGEWSGQVKLGMAGQVEIVTGREPLLRLLAKRIRHSLSLH